jgi:hypothetical protein
MDSQRLQITMITNCIVEDSLGSGEQMEENAESVETRGTQKR